MPTLSEVLHDILVDSYEVTGQTLSERSALARTRVKLRYVVSRLRDKAIVTPETFRLDTDDWVTHLPIIEAHGTSPEDSLSAFMDKLEEVERNA